MKFKQLRALILIFLSSPFSGLAQAGKISVDSVGTTFLSVVNLIKADSSLWADTSEGGQVSKIERYIDFWTPRAVVTNSSSTNMFDDYRNALGDALQTRFAAAGKSTASGACQSSGFSGSWKLLGPDYVPEQVEGYANCLWADPANTGLILAGTNGGLFRTMNGNATNIDDVEWECLTDNAPIANGIMAVTDIAVNPNDFSEIYVATGSEADIQNDILGINHLDFQWGGGILWTDDGGLTWTQVSVTGNPFDHVSKLYYTEEPESLSGSGYTGRWLYACVSTYDGPQVYRCKPDGNFNWVNLTAAQGIPGINDLDYNLVEFDDPLTSGFDQPKFKGRWGDIDFVPGENCTRMFTSLMTTADWHQANIWQCVIGHNGTSYTFDWECITCNISSSQNVWLNSNNGSRIRFETSIPKYDLSMGSSDHYLYSICFASAGQTRILRYDLDPGNTGSWTTLTNTNLPGNPNKFKFQFVVSSANPNNAYFGSNHPYFINNLKTSPTIRSIGTYFAGDEVDPTNWATSFSPLALGPTHCDIRDLYLIPDSDPNGDGSGDILLIANDGGVSRKAAGVSMTTGSTWLASRSINGKGFASAHMWNISTTENGGLAAAGAWHSGLFSYEPTKTPQWKFDSRYPDFESSTWHGSDASSTVFDYNSRTAYGLEGKRPSKSVSGTRDIDSWEAFYSGWASSGQADMSYRVPFTTTAGSNRFAGRINLVNENGSGWNEVNLYTLSGTIRSLAFQRNSTLPNPIGYIVRNWSLDLSYRNPTYQNDFFLTTGSLPSGHIISDVTTDEENTERVWVSMGGVAPASTSGAVKRAYYSPNHGTTWYDVSYGLPDRMPVVQIIYRNGADELFAATDVGMYRCDFSGFDPNVSYPHGIEWVCFNNGEDPAHNFPAGYVTDLDINYCTGKLYASILGRSIWATDIFPITENAGFDDITFTSNQSWTGEHYEITGNVVVKNNSTLTIGDGSTPTTIHMPRGARILVEPGSRLVVDNATITNSCPECMWDGIIAEGNPSLAQTPTNQGTVIVKNGSVIEHAKVAFANGWMYDDVVNQEFVPRFGGYIEAENSVFKNNAVGADIKQYTGYNFVNNPINDKCKFDKCEFVIDNEYKGDKIGLPFEAHAKLYAVLGIKFSSCSLTNVKTTAPIGEGIGIRAVDASFKVQPFCPGNYTGPCDRSYFSGFRRGISAEGTMTPGFTPYIDQADFDNSSIGIYISKMNNVSATRNKFTIGHGMPIHPVPEGCYQNIGIFARNAQAFNIRENIFEGTPATFSNPLWETFGTIIINSGINNNVIRGNSYSKLKYGAHSMGVNGSPTQPGVGLQYHCNTFSENKNAIFVHSDHPLHGISTWQGYVYLDPGNYFDPINPNVVDIQNEGYTVYYPTLALYSGAPTQLANVILMPYSPQLGEPEMVSCTNLSEYAHPVKTDAGMGNVHALNANVSTLKASLASGIDGGSTSGLLSYLETMTISDTADVYDSLLALSPYISEPALRAMVDENELIRPQQYEVLMANPDVLRAEGFIDYLEALPSPAFTFPQITALKWARFNITARTMQEASLAQDYVLLTLEKQAVIRNMMALEDSVAWDTVHTTYEYDLDTLDFVYRDFPTNWADYDLAGLYFRLGDTTESDAILSGMPYATFDTGQLAEYERMMIVYTILRDMEREARDTFTVDEDSLLTTFAVFESEDNARVLGQNLKVIINNEPGIKAYGPCRTPAERPAPNNNNPAEPLQNLEAGNFVVAVPNPATDKVQFRYNVPNANGSMKISIINATGQPVAQLKCSGTQGSVTWEAGQLPAGTYIYRLTDEKGVIATRKLTLLK